MRPRTSWRRRLVVFSLFAALLALWLPASSHVRAASLLQRFASPEAPGPLGRVARQPIQERDFPLPDTRARIYLPLDVKRPSGIVLVHGVHYKGIDEPRLERFARTIAATGVAVLTPEVRELCDYRIEPASIDTIGLAAQALSARLGGKAVGVMGLSFAGGLSLIAATEPKWAPSIAFVVAVGAHDDLGRVLRFFTSNRAPRPDGTVEELHAHDYGTAVLAYSHVEDFFAPEDVEAAREALRDVLHEDFDGAKARAAALSPAGAAKMKHVFDHDVAPMAAELDAEIARLEPGFAAVSPSAHLAAIRVPVFLLHGAGDSVIPASETEWLAHDTPRGMLRDALVSRAIEHVELEGTPGIGDRLKLVHFMAEVLDAADDER